MSPSPMSLPLRGTRILRECIMMFLCIDSDCSLFLHKNTAQCRTGAMHNAGGELRLLGILGSSELPWCSDVFCAMAHIHPPQTRVCCLRYVTGRGSDTFLPSPLYREAVSL